MPPVFACSQGRGAKIGAADALSKFGSMRKLAKKERQPIVAYRYLQLRHRYVTVTLLLRYHTVTLPFQEREPELLPLEACIKLSNRRGVRTCHPPPTHSAYSHRVARPSCVHLTLRPVTCVRHGLNPWTCRLGSLPCVCARRDLIPSI